VDTGGLYADSTDISTSRLSVILYFSDIARAIPGRPWGAAEVAHEVALVRLGG
jgi:hypothetical protein